MSRKLDDNQGIAAVSLESPEGGFLPVEYRLTIHLDDVTPLADITFTILLRLIPNDQSLSISIVLFFLYTERFTFSYVLV